MRQGEPGDTMFVVQTGDVIATHRVTGEPGEGQEVGGPELCLYTSLQCGSLSTCLLSVCVSSKPSLTFYGALRSLAHCQQAHGECLLQPGCLWFILVSETSPVFAALDVWAKSIFCRQGPGVS